MRRIHLPAALLAVVALLAADLGQAGDKTAKPDDKGFVPLFDGKSLKTKIYSRDELQPGRSYPGPAVITEYSATTLVPPRIHFRNDKASNLIVAL